jgi:hypothetical protein
MAGTVIMREGGYKIGNISSFTVSTVAVAFADNGTYHLHNTGSGTIYMGVLSTIGPATASWNIDAGEKTGPFYLTPATYFIASAANTLKYFQYLY